MNTSVTSRKQSVERPPQTAWRTLSQHWPEYSIEAGALAVFMVSACVFGVLLEHPSSPLHQAFDDMFVRRIFMGVAMGVTAIAIIYSRWGQRSGAHINPAVTLTFFTLGRVTGWDTLFYLIAQFAGAIAGVLIAAGFIGFPLRHSAVNFVVTRPGPFGVVPALAAEICISFLMMLAVLTISNRRSLSRYTGLAAGLLIAIYIAFEAPISGMSMNPARSLGSAVAARDFTAVWLYFAGPVTGMLTASLLYRYTHGAKKVFCAKLHHDNNQRCIFRCNYGSLISKSQR